MGLVGGGEEVAGLRTAERKMSQEQTMRKHAEGLESCRTRSVVSPLFFAPARFYLTESNVHMSQSVHAREG